MSQVKAGSSKKLDKSQPFITDNRVAIKGRVHEISILKNKVPSEISDFTVTQQICISLYKLSNTCTLSFR